MRPTIQTAPARRAVVLALTLVALAALSGCGGDSGRTTITFFQFKPEAVAFFQDLARDFEEEHPDIRVVVDNVPDPETALRTRLVKGKVPDVLTLNANGTFGEFASAGIFEDFAGTDLLDGVNPAYADVLGQLGASRPGAVNGIPFAANASGILYNTELFEQYDVAVPTTWDELVDAAKTFQDADVTPFEGMLGDSWTPQSPLAPLTAQTQSADFFEERFADDTTFATGWREAAEKLRTLYDYTQPNAGVAKYVDGTQAFAQGKAAMLPLGSYAVPQVRSFEPEFEIGSFAFPATDDPERTTLVSGVDVAFTVGADSAHKEEAREFIRFALQRPVVERYAEEQVAIPTLTGLANDDPALTGVQSYIDEGKIVGFTDHQFIPAIPLSQLLQEYLLGGGSAEAFLRRLDASWDQVAERRTWGVGAVRS